MTRPADPSGAILIVRLGSLGDLIHTLPAFAALRRARPDARIDWLVEAPHRALLDLVDGLSNVVVLKGRSASGWLATASDLKRRGYGTAIDFQGLLKSATLARLSGAGETVGFDRDGLREPMARWLYSRRVAVGEGRHVIDKNLALAAAVDVARSVPQLRDSSNLTAADFPLRPVDSPALASLRAQGIDRYALVNPGAAWPNKRWPADRFGAVARVLADRHALTPIVLWGPNERALAQAVADASGGAAVVAPETQLPDLVALARGASFMISGDTGPLHIACAAGVPTVSLFGPTIAERNGPWNPRDLVITRYGDCACSYKRQCQVPERWCLGRITVEEVAEAVRARLLP